MDRGACWATVLGVTESRIQLSDSLGLNYTLETQQCPAPML